MSDPSKKGWSWPFLLVGFGIFFAAIATVGVFTRPPVVEYVGDPYLVDEVDSQLLGDLNKVADAASSTSERRDAVETFLTAVASLDRESRPAGYQNTRIRIGLSRDNMIPLVAYRTQLGSFFDPSPYAYICRVITVTPGEVSSDFHKCPDERVSIENPPGGRWFDEWFDRVKE